MEVEVVGMGRCVEVEEEQLGDVETVVDGCVVVEEKMDEMVVVEGVYVEEEEEGMNEMVLVLVVEI